MRELQHAVHRTIVVVDVERFGDPGRTDLDQLAVRDGLYKALIQAFGGSGIKWDSCVSEDRGDGALILVPAEVPKAFVVISLPGRLAEAVSGHNSRRAAPEQMRLRVALHAGEVYRDAHGVAGSAVNHAFRLAQAPALRSALAASPEPLAVIVSDWLFIEVVRHIPAAEPGSYRKVRVAVKETEAAGWIRIPDPGMIYGGGGQGAEALYLPSAGGVAPDAAAARGTLGPAAPATESVAAATCTLPPDAASFTGRGPELTELIAVVAETAISGEAAAICEIGGMAGIGKTALAVHAARQVAERFPDGQFFLPLNGHAPGRQPVDPADALASLLQTAGIPAQQIPDGLHLRAGLWRDHAVGKRLLLVLDDAAGHDQIRHLLPGAARTLVLITTRRHLTALEDAKVISLDPLPPAAAAGLLVRLADRAGLTPEDDAVRQITKLCGYLPLAVGMLARQLRHHPAWTAGDLAEDLTVARDRLALMRAENLSVAAAFDLSYQDLTPGGQRLFRRLGLNPGTDIDAYAAAALDGSDLMTADRNLGDLYDHYLLTESAHGRYSMHDLIAEHAKGLAAGYTDADRDTVTDRVLDYYLYTASAASRLIPWRTSIAGPSSPRPPPAQAPELCTEERAINWMETEHSNLHACIDYAASHERLAHAIGITIAISDVMHAQGHWKEAFLLAQTALAAARAAGDRRAQAWALNRLGIAQELNGDYPAAASSQDQARQLFHDLGDQRGEAWALNQLGLVQWLTGDYPAAVLSQEQAQLLFAEIGDPQGQASVLNQLGVVQRLTRNYPAAISSQEQALRLFREVSDRRGQAWALNEIGMIQQLTEDYPAAVTSQNEALQLFCRIVDQQGQAWAVLQLSVVQRLTRDPQAASNRHEALHLFRVLGDRRGQAYALIEEGIVQMLNGDYSAAVSILTQARNLFRELGDRQGHARTLLQLGAALQQTGDRQAAAVLAEAQQLFRDLGDRYGEAEVANLSGR